MFCYNYVLLLVYEVLQLLYFLHLVTPDDLECPLYLAFLPHLQHLLHLGQKCVTVEAKNLKHDLIIRFPLIIG